MLQVLTLLLACAPKSADTADSGSPPGVTVEVHLSDTFPNMVIASFFSEQALDGAGLRVEVAGEERVFDAFNGARLVDEAADRVAIAAGLPFDSDLRVTPFVVDDAEQDFDPVELTTGALPSDIPVAAVSGSPADVWSLTSTGGTGWAPLVLAPDGTPAWWVGTGWTDTAVVRLRPTPDATGLSFMRFTTLAADQGEVPDGFATVGWDGHILEEEEIANVHHDFLYLPDGSRLWLEYDDQERDGATVRGDRLMRRWPDGTDEELTSTWEEVSYDPRYNEEIAGRTYWTHANSLDYDPLTGHVLMSLRNYGAIVAIDPDSGTWLWRFMPGGGDYVLQDPGSYPVGQHGIEATGDGFLLYDNGPADAADSRVRRYRLDADGTAEELWSHGTDPAHYSLVLGDVRWLPGGNMRVSWSGEGALEDFDEAGQTLGRLDLPDGAYIGFLDVEEGLFGSR